MLVIPTSVCLKFVLGIQPPKPPLSKPYIKETQAVRNATTPKQMCVIFDMFPGKILRSSCA